METRKDWHGKKTISLLGLTQLGLIIVCNSGVVYTNQAGGYSCMHPEEEGILSIIGDDYGMSDRVMNALSKCLLNVTGLSESDADTIDDILKNDQSTFFLSVDRNRLNDSMEAWLYVDIDEQPSVPIDAYNFNSISKKEWELYKQKYSHIKNPDMFPIYGFGKSKGVLTWFNSD